MKKRILALVCAMTMVLAMSLSVCAAGSPSAASASQNQPVVTSGENTFGQSFGSDTIVFFANDTTIEGGTVSQISEADYSKLLAYAKAKWGKDFFVASLFNLDGKTGTITAHCSNVWVGQNVVTLHEKADGTIEELVTTVTKDNYVTFTVNSNSPFGFFVLSNSSASPKTGEIVAMICALAAISGFGAVACAKKAKRD